MFTTKMTESHIKCAISDFMETKTCVATHPAKSHYVSSEQYVQTFLKFEVGAFVI